MLIYITYNFINDYIIEVNHHNNKHIIESYFYFIVHQPTAWG